MIRALVRTVIAVHRYYHWFVGRVCRVPAPLGFFFSKDIEGDRSILRSISGLQVRNFPPCFVQSSIRLSLRLVIYYGINPRTFRFTSW